MPRPIQLSTSSTLSLLKCMQQHMIGLHFLFGCNAAVSLYLLTQCSHLSVNRKWHGLYSALTLLKCIQQLMICSHVLCVYWIVTVSGQIQNATGGLEGLLVKTRTKKGHATHDAYLSHLQCFSPLHHAPFCPLSNRIMFEMFSDFPNGIYTQR